MFMPIQDQTPESCCESHCARGTRRRLFLRWSLFGVGAAVLGQFGMMLAGFAWPKRLRGRDAYVSLGRIDDLRIGEVREFKFAKILLSRVPEGFLAFYGRCTHRGCTVKWEAERPSEDDLAPFGSFGCVCHGSFFDRYGQIVAGPAPRPLDVFPIRIHNGELFTSNSRITLIERTREDATAGIVSAE